MAYSAAARRYSLVGAPLPTGLDQQARYAIVGATLPIYWYEGDVTPTLGAFTASFAGTFAAAPTDTWDVKDRFAILHLAYPDGTITEKDRLTIAGAPGTSGETPGAGTFSGDIAATLGGFTTSLVGTVEPPGTFQGDIDATLGSFTASLTGTHYYDLFFSVGYQISPTWLFNEAPKRDGDLTPTLSAFTTALAGTALPPDSTTGSMSPTIGGFTASLAGTVELPSASDGQMQLDIENFAMSFNGTAVPGDSSIGAISATIRPFTASLSGTYDSGTFSGSMPVTIGAFTASWRGQFVDSNAVNGDLDAIIGSFRGGFIGTVGKSPLEVDVIMKVDSAASAYMDVDSSDTAKMRVK